VATQFDFFLNRVKREIALIKTGRNKMLDNKKRQAKVHKTLRLEFVVSSALSEYSKKCNISESHIIELALKEYFEARDNEKNLKLVSNQLDIISSKLERIELGMEKIFDLASQPQGE
jgi:hypothetical protein